MPDGLDEGLLVVLLLVLVLGFIRIDVRPFDATRCLSFDVYLVMKPLVTMGVLVLGRTHIYKYSTSSIECRFEPYASSRACVAIRGYQSK